MTYYAEYYVDTRLYRTPVFDSLDDIRDYVADIPGARIYLAD